MLLNTPDKINNFNEENKDIKIDDKYEKSKLKNEKEEILNDEDPEFLHKKLLEEKELIKQKQEENRILKQKIAEYENRKNQSLNNIKNNSDNKNSSDNKLIIINNPISNNDLPFNTNQNNENEKKIKEIMNEKNKEKMLETREKIKNNIVNSFKNADDIMKLREGIKKL